MVVIKRARPISSAPSASLASQATKVRRGDVRRAVVVRTKYPTRRPDGRYIRFDDNAAVLVNSQKEMVGNRIGGVVAAELRSKGWGKSEYLSCVLGPPGTRLPVATAGEAKRACRSWTVDGLVWSPWLTIYCTTVVSLAPKVV